MIRKRKKLRWKERETHLQRERRRIVRTASAFLQSMHGSDNCFPGILRSSLSCNQALEKWWWGRFSPRQNLNGGDTEATETEGGGSLSSMIVIMLGGLSRCSLSTLHAASPGSCHSSIPQRVLLNFEQVFELPETSFLHGSSLQYSMIIRLN